MTKHSETARVADALLRYPSCLIVTHINPEGDAIGSQLALAMALEQRGITVSCYDRDGVPEICRFLPTWERVATSLPAVIPPLVVYVDADCLDRCGLSEEDLPGAEMFVRIDHHTARCEDPGPALVDTRAAATGELIFELLSHMHMEITPEIATCLMDALMVDTGRFSYTNTTPTTHRIAADLVAAGADVPTIVEWTWGRARLSALKLKGFALNSLQISKDGRIAWAVLRDEDFKAARATPEDTEGIIDQVRKVQGAEVAILFSEKRGVTRVSLRSAGEVDVARVANQFGGGGHKKAAGATLETNLEDGVAAVLQVVEAALLSTA